MSYCWLILIPIDFPFLRTEGAVMHPLRYNGRAVTITRPTEGTYDHFLADTPWTNRLEP